MIWKNLLPRMSFFLALLVAIHGAIHAAEAAPLVPIKVLTFNTWILRVQIQGSIPIARDIDARLKVIPAEVARTGADIIGFQEIWDRDARNRLIAELALLGYPYAIHKPQEAAYESVGVGDAGEIRPEGLRGRLGNGLLVVSRYPLHAKVEQLNFKNYTAPEEYFARKGALHTWVQVPGVGWIDFFDSHLGAVAFNERKNRYNRWHEAMRYLQTIELAEFIRSSSKSRIRILTADLNVDPHAYDPENRRHDPEKLSRDYKLLRDYSSLKDTFHLIRGFPLPPINTYDPETNPYARGQGSIRPSLGIYIDYILAGDQKAPSGQDCVRVDDSQVVFREPVHSEEYGKVFLSDHYGVLSSLRLDPHCGLQESP